MFPLWPPYPIFTIRLDLRHHQTHRRSLDSTKFRHTPQLSCKCRRRHTCHTLHPTRARRSNTHKGRRSHLLLACKTRPRHMSLVI